MITSNANTFELLPITFDVLSTCIFEKLALLNLACIMAHYRHYNCWYDFIDQLKDL